MKDFPSYTTGHVKGHVQYLSLPFFPFFSCLLYQVLDTLCFADTY